MTDAFADAGFRVTTVSEPSHAPDTPPELLPAGLEQAGHSCASSSSSWKPPETELPPDQSRVVVGACAAQPHIGKTARTAADPLVRGRALRRPISATGPDPPDLRGRRTGGTTWGQQRGRCRRVARTPAGRRVVRVGHPRRRWPRPRRARRRATGTSLITLRSVFSPSGVKPLGSLSRTSSPFVRVSVAGSPPEVTVASRLPICRKYAPAP